MPADQKESVRKERTNGTLGRIFPEPAEERFDKEELGKNPGEEAASHSWLR